MTSTGLSWLRWSYTLRKLLRWAGRNVDKEVRYVDTFTGVTQMMAQSNRYVPPSWSFPSDPHTSPSELRLSRPPVSRFNVGQRQQTSPKKFAVVVHQDDVISPRSSSTTAHLVEILERLGPSRSAFLVFLSSLHSLISVSIRGLRPWIRGLLP